MRNRDTGVLALGRFLAVERYCQSTHPSPTHLPVRSSRPDGTGPHPAAQGQGGLRPSSGGRVSS
jgi:hypothetical protein